MFGHHFQHGQDEATCPVKLELLGLLLRSSEERAIELVDEQDPRQRARLTAFCFQCAHMRDLGVLVASRCDERALRHAEALIGELLIEQVQERASRTSASKSRITPGGAARRRTVQRSQGPGVVESFGMRSIALADAGQRGSAHAGVHRCRGHRRYRRPSDPWLFSSGAGTRKPPQRGGLQKSGH